MNEISEVAPLAPDADLDAVRHAVAKLIEYIRTREPISVGDESLKFLTMSRAANLGLLSQSVSSGTYTPAPPPGPDDPSDPSPPDPITGLVVTAAISHFFIEFDAPTYPQGHGNAYTEVYGANYSGTGPLPTFADAVLVGTIAGKGNIGSISAQPGQTTHFWVGAVTRDGIRQVDASGPTGGTNGVSAKTALDVRTLLDALTAAAQNSTSPYSKIVFRADLFYIGNSAGTFDEIPFYVTTTSIVQNGVTVPPGVYMRNAFIANGTITNAMIGNATIDSAKIASLAADKITAGSMQVGSYIQSTGYTGTSATEWRIDATGVARFSGVIVKGQIIATSGQIGGADILSGYVESTNYNGLGLGWRLDNTLGKVFCGKLLVSNVGATRIFDTEATGTQPILKAGTALSVLANGDATYAGDLSAANGTLGTLTIAAGGHIKAGQTAYNTGVGQWAGWVSTIYKWSLGDSSGPGITWDGSSLSIRTPEFDTFSASISGGTMTATQPGSGTFSVGSRTVSVSGGLAPYKFHWVFQNTDQMVGFSTFISSGITSDTVVLSAWGTGTDYGLFLAKHGVLLAVVTDANGRVTTATVSSTVNFASAGVGGE